MSKHGLKILGLAVMAVVGLMAFSATSALAVNLNLIDEPETGEAGFFLSSGAERPTGLTHETIGGTVGPGKLLIPGKAAEIACTEGKIVKNASGEEAFVQNEYENFKTATMNKGGHLDGVILFLGCKVNKINATTGALEGELTKCTEELNKELLAALPGSHHTQAQMLVKVKKHETVPFVLATPLLNSKASAEESEKLTAAFTTIKFGGTCSLPETVKVTGGFAAKLPTTDSNKPVLKVDTFSEAGKTEQALLGAKLKFGANEAFIQGEITAELTGAGAALSWGGM